MEVIHHIAQFKKWRESRPGLSMGLIPTMGHLHQGHLSLLAQSKLDNALSVASLYVNPTQFNNPDDFGRYPRSQEHDLALLQASGCDAVFIPNDAEMYPRAVQISFDFGSLSQVMEGRYRPGHFSGVAQVVSKLLHIIQPQRAYFGMKDLQQCRVVGLLVQELLFPVELVLVPTVREASGLALSSRNSLLTSDQRNQAAQIYVSLKAAADKLSEGHSPDLCRRLAQTQLEEAGLQVEYFEIVNFESLQTIKAWSPEQEVALCVAAYLGTVRLIDNLYLGSKY